MTKTILVETVTRRSAIQKIMGYSKRAAARGDQDAISNRNRVARRMTPAQIAEAQELAREWKSKPER